MVVVAKSSSIEGLTRIQMIPYWWMTVHWREQYPLQLNCRGDISMETVKLRHQPDELLAYCPTWAAGKKKGRPKADTWEKGIADHIKELGKKKRKRAVRMFCKICHKYNHNTKECFKNPLNKNKDSATDHTTDHLESGSSQQENEILGGQEGMA
jgi:hypothetical protein